MFKIEDFHFLCKNFGLHGGVLEQVSLSEETQSYSTH